MEVTRARAQAEFAELAWLLTEYTTGVAAIDEPQSWHGGDIDAARTTQLAIAPKKLQRPDSVVRLEQNGSAYAAGHNAAELRRWIIRFCAAVEPDQTNEASEKARGLRHVQVHHDVDGNEHQPSTCCSMQNHALAQALVEYFDREQNQAA